VPSLRVPGHLSMVIVSKLNIKCQKKEVVVEQKKVL